MTLAKIASAKNRARQMVNRRSNNASHRSLLRTQIKKVLVAIEAKDKEEALKKARYGFWTENYTGSYEIEEERD